MYPFTKPKMEMFAGTHIFLLDSGKPNARQITLDISGCAFSYSLMPTPTPTLTP